MKIVSSVQVSFPTLHFRQPFKIAYEEVTSISLVTLKLTDTKGNEGLGSASPDTEVTGENVEEVYNMLRAKLTPSFFSLPLEHIYAYHDLIATTFAGYPSAQMAVEEALLRLYCAQKNMSLISLFGGYKDSCESLMTIGIKNTSQTIKDIKQWSKQGFKLIKLKCGIHAKDDVKKIRDIYPSLPANTHLALDANQGYSLADAEYVLKHISKLPIVFLEQPISAKNINGLKKLTMKYKTPIFADESIIGVEDAVKLLTGNFVDGINVKLMKCGGPLNFLRIFHLAKSLNKKIMIGCMYESNISITTGAALALALPLDFVDLDSGHLDFKDDPTIGGAIIKAGKVKIGKKQILLTV